MRTRVRTALRIIWIMLGLALLLFIVFRNVPPSGRLVVEAFPGKPSAFVSPIRPESRVEVERTDDGYVFVVRDEPAYFNLAALPFMRSAVVRLEYRNEGQPEFRVGGRTSLEEWRFDLKELETAATTTDGWTVGEARWELGPLAADDAGEVQMVLSLPAMQEGNAAPLRVRRIEVEYRRPALTLENIFIWLSEKTGA
jgi:hypothetical protein